MDADRPGAPGRHEDGLLHAEITRLVVQVTREYTGRGPTRARTHINDDLVVVLMGHTLTKGERTLVRDGMEERVLQVRQDFQRTMREELTEGIERLTGRRVKAFMSGNHIEPDLACEVFVLE